MKLTLIFAVQLILALSGLAQAQSGKLQESIYFETGKYNLSAESKHTLDRLIDSLRKFESYKISIQGNTDNVGDSIFNQKLSEQRVEATRSYFISKGFTNSILSIEADGEQKPIADNETSEGKQKNRRVDIVVSYKLPDVPSIQELYKQLATTPLEFCINPNRDTVLRCKQGTVINVKANSFKLPKSCKNECITIKVKEDFAKSDMLLDNLSTMAGNRILETQGMIYTEAVDCKEKNLKLAKGKDLTIFVPTDTIIPRMKIFEGNRNPHDEAMNWTVSNNSVLENFTIEQLSTCSEWLCGGRCFTCERCKFFFCRFTRIDDFFQGATDRIKHSSNKSFRKCQRKLRRERRFARRTGQPLPTSTCYWYRIFLEPNLRSKCERLEELFKKYNVTNAADLVYQLNKPLMDRFGVTTVAALRDSMATANTKNIELAYLNRNISFDDLKYYVYNTTKLGWSNVDAFADIPKDQMVKVNINQIAQKNIDCKIIFIDRNFVIPAKVENYKYKFDDLPKGEKIWIVAIKYDKGQPFLSMQETVIEKKTYNLEFKAMTLRELKEQLLKLDKK